MKPVVPQWSRAQVEFVEALRQAGATNADAAASLDSTMRLSETELAPLVESGLVREAGRGRYYLYGITRTKDLMLAMADFERKEAADIASPGRFIKTILFWVIMILIPIILMQIIQ